MGRPVVHFEIIGTDPARLRGYQGELFGWEFQTGDAVRAHLLEMTGDLEAARACYRRAVRLTTSLPEQRYLRARAAGLTINTDRAPERFNDSL